MYENLPTTKEEAKRLGAKRYFTGKLCCRGHLSPRYAYGMCVACKSETRKRPPRKLVPLEIKKAKKRERDKLWRENNKGKIRLYRRRWKLKNREKYQSFYYKQSYQNAINLLINRRRVAYTGTGEKWVGCCTEKFIEYLEDSFLINMNWNNRDKWELDHIRPISTFDLLNEEQRKLCFNYANLQPIWKEDNRKKSNSYCLNDEFKWVHIMRESGYKGELFTKYLSKINVIDRVLTPHPRL